MLFPSLLYKLIIFFIVSFETELFPNDFIVTIKFQCHLETKYLEEKIFKYLKHIGLKFLMATTIYNSLSN